MFFSHYFFLKALLDYCCYDDRALRWLDNTIKRLIKNETVPSPDAMISWCKENRCLDPHTVIKVVHYTNDRVCFSFFRCLLFVSC